MSRIPSATSGESLVCFVCDSGVVGRYYTLASCRTQATRVKLVEKLGHLVGDGYLVIVAEDDIICRGCATMVNSVDKLEKELTSLRTMVLRYLEKKYELEEGELVNTRASITPRVSEKKPEPVKRELLEFQARKRRALRGEVDVEELKDSWVRCDSCKYARQDPPPVAAHHPQQQHQPPNSRTTAQQSKLSAGAVENKLPRLAAQPLPPSIEAQSQQPMIVQSVHVVDKATNGAGKLPESQTYDDEGEDALAQVPRMAQQLVQMKGGGGIEDGDDSVEMISADLGADFPDDSASEGVEADQILQMAGGKHVTLQSVEGEDGASTLCMVDENGIIVQKVEQAEDGTLYVQMADSSDPTKQMLSVGEDGSVQMVEVLWGDEMGAGGEDSETPTIVNY